MPRAPWTKSVFFAAAEVFVERCLRNEDSLFTPGREVWTAAATKELQERLTEEDLRDLTFSEKILEHIEGASQAAYQLTAELLYVVLLPEHDTGAPKKLEHIDAVLAHVPGVSIPTDLAEALKTGIASYAQGRKRRDAYLRFFIEFLLGWTALPLSQRAELLRDPWAFRDLVDETPKHSGTPQAEALLYIVFPDTFEPIIASDAKRKIAKRFEPVVPQELRDENVDRKIAALRAEIEPVLGPAFTYYDEPVRRVWSSSDGDWHEFLTWATRLYESPEFDTAEREYKSLRLQSEFENCGRQSRAGQSTGRQRSVECSRAPTTSPTGRRTTRSRNGVRRTPRTPLASSGVYGRSVRSIPTLSPGFWAIGRRRTAQGTGYRSPPCS